MTVMVTYPHANTVSQNFCWSMLNLDRNNIHSILPTRGYPGTGLIIARNSAVQNFLRSSAEWLWTVDTDIGFEPNTLSMLMNHGHDGYKVISGLYSTVMETGTLYLDNSTSYREYPLALREVEDGRFKPFDSYEGSMEVDAVGAGCLLVHRSVFQDIGEAGWYDTERGMGEDISFCVKARRAGHKILCDTTIELSHYKSIWLRG